MTQPTQDPNKCLCIGVLECAACPVHNPPATKPLDEQIDEILADSIGMDFCENDECSHYGQYLEAHTAIKALITNAEKQARIDELKRLQNDPKAIFETSNFTDNTKLLTIVLPQASITDRIKELEQSNE